MALPRLLASKLQHRLAPPTQLIPSLAPASRAVLSRFSAQASSGKEVAVESADSKKKRWRSLLPRRLHRRRNNLVPSFNDLFNSGFGNALLEASQNMNRLLESVVPSGMAGRIRERDDSYRLRYEVPGLAKEELKVTVDDGVLNIRGEHKEAEDQGDESDDEYWSARSYGFYNASVVLPDDAKHEEIKAELKDGVLTIVVPKDEKKVKQIKEVQIQ